MIFLLAFCPQAARAMPGNEMPPGLGGAPATDKPAPDKPALDKPAIEKPAVDKPSIDQPAAERPATEKPAVDTSAFDPKVDLKRIRVGDQATVLRIMSADNSRVLYDKGVDAKGAAPVTDKDRKQIFSALGIPEDRLNETASLLMENYTKVSERKKCLALLGIIGTTPGTAVTELTRATLQTFFVARLTDSWGHANAIILKRQAILNLALLPMVDATAVEAVLAFFERCTNLWETFPVPQFFEYHAADIKALPNADAIRARVAAVKSLYTAQVLKSFTTTSDGRSHEAVAPTP